MRFASPLFLLLFFLWIPVISVYIAVGRRQRHRFLSHFSLFQQNDIVSFSSHRIWARRIFLISALVFLTLAAARPQMGASEIALKGEGIDVAVVFDVSLSMLADDENGSRFDKGKRLLVDAISELGGDRIAIIPFAGSAFLQLPLTSDYATAFAVISSLSPGMISKQGTALGNAIEMGVESLMSAPDNADKLLVVISDGEDPHIDFAKIKELLEKNHVSLAILPLGTAEGAPIKVGESYLEDKAGNMVISKLNKEFYDKCVDSLGAMEIQKGETLSGFIKSFRKKSIQEEKSIHLYTERFQIPLGLGIFLFILFMGLPAGRRKRK